MPAFEALLTPEGQELLHRLRHEDDPAGLRLGTELRARYPVELVTSALAQHELRLRARAKFSRALDDVSAPRLGYPEAGI